MGGIDTVSVAADAVLLSQVIPYTSTVQLEVLFDDQLEVVFVGPISSVDWEHGTCRLRLISPLVELQEARRGGAAFWTAEPHGLRDLSDRRASARDDVLSGSGCLLRAIRVSRISRTCRLRTQFYSYGSRRRDVGRSSFRRLRPIGRPPPMAYA
jgi:hypothetical protein